MGSGVSVRLGRFALAILVPVATALPLWIASPPSAQAQAVIACATISLYNFDPVPAGTVNASRTETIQLKAGDTVTVSWSGLTFLSVTIDGLPLSTLGPSGSATFTAPSTRGYVFSKRVSGGPGFVHFGCAPQVVPPVVPGGPVTMLDFLNTHYSTVLKREPIRVIRLLDIMTKRNELGIWEYYADLYRRLREIDSDFEEFGHAMGYERSVELSKEREQVVDQLESIRNRPDYDPERAARVEASVRSENQFAQGFPILQGIEFAPRRQSPIDPTLSAISQYFDNPGDGTLSATVPLQSRNPDWTFDVLIDGALIDRTFAALNQQTKIGTVTLATTYRWDEQTVLLGGIKIGAANSVFSGLAAATVSTTQIGLDLAIAREFTPSLHGALYTGYEFGSNVATLGGINSPYDSHTLKLGGELEGTIPFDAFTMTPSISALLQYYHQPAFIDGTGAAVALIDTLDLDVIGGVSIERDFRMVESGVTVTPSLTLNGWVDYSSSSAGPGPIPPDAFKVQLVGSVAATWDEGATLSLSADIARGATTTMYGASAGLSVPIN